MALFTPWMSSITWMLPWNVTLANVDNCSLGIEIFIVINYMSSFGMMRKSLSGDLMEKYFFK